MHKSDVPADAFQAHSGTAGKSSSCAGCLIINADDWGSDFEATERTLDCIQRGVVSSVSAMVFMEDSERAAAVARDHSVDAGLHLNFTTRFTAARGHADLATHQDLLSRHLLRNRFAQGLFHPGLRRSFEYVISAQLDEFERLYGHKPTRLDGHHHMHLCSNVILASLLPSDTIVRRSFSFSRGEKGLAHFVYRRVIDHLLCRRHTLTDFFFSLEPLQPISRLMRISRLSRRYIVELETHPRNPAEYSFLNGDGIRNVFVDCPLASHFCVETAPKNVPL